MKALITVGCMTDHGAVISLGDSSYVVDGKAVHLDGMTHFCPRCKVQSKAIASNQGFMMVSGRSIVAVGDQSTCGSRYLKISDLAVMDRGSGNLSNYSRNLKSTNIPQNPKHDLANSFVSQDKYENYYIEQNKTDYVKFKTGIPPYDKDKKGGLGALSQLVSGVCDFIVTYVVDNKRLFITVSYIPPIVKYDAKSVIPSASVRLYKDKDGKFELLINQKLKLEKGIWDTDRRKEPVGSCEIFLPEPDLSSLRAELDLGYILRFDGGTVTPIPSFMTHSFTLKSSSRKAK